MQFFIFILSYLLLSTIGSLIYLGLFLLFIFTMKKAFKMNEQKWTNFFSYQKGKGMYYALIFPYLLMIAIMLPVSFFWFEWIHIEYKTLAALSIILIITLTGVVKFPKIKHFIKGKYGAHPS